MKVPISVSTGQVDAFPELHLFFNSFNARYAQHFNGRVILEDATVVK